MYRSKRIHQNRQGDPCKQTSRRTYCAEAQTDIGELDGKRLNEVAGRHRLLTHLRQLLRHSAQTVGHAVTGISKTSSCCLCAVQIAPPSP